MKFSSVYNVILFVSFNYCLSTWWTVIVRKKPMLILNNHSKQDIRVISSRNRKSFHNSQLNFFLEKDDCIANKKLITISPGGFKGFYLLGILSYLKENYETYDFIYSGASAGAWNALFMCYRGNSLTFLKEFLDDSIINCKSIIEIQFLFKKRLLKMCDTKDFDLSKLFIGVTTFHFFVPKINIYSDFENLEDAINCCIASSHIPFITGGMTNTYKNLFSFDGGFSDYPYLSRERALHVSYTMWEKLNNTNMHNNCIANAAQKCMKNIEKITKFQEYFSASKNNFKELFNQGFHDAYSNRHILDNLFDRKVDMGLFLF